MSDIIKTYAQVVADTVAQIASETEAIDKAAQLVADAIKRDELVHVIGPGGHSNMAVEEVLWRAGGLAPVDAILDAGKRIPEDYSVCGCDNTSVAHYRGISLTTVNSYPIQSGQEAIELLVRKLEHEDMFSVEEDPDGITQIEYYPKLIVRKTTGPCRKK